jgi:hypothetical protein
VKKTALSQIPASIKFPGFFFTFAFRLLPFAFSDYRIFS